MSNVGTVEALPLHDQSFRPDHFFRRDELDVDPEDLLAVASAAAYALARMPTVSRHGGKPMVWMDVEGPYANGPFWQQEQTTDPLAQPNPNAVAVNRAVIQGVVDGLRRAAP